MRGAEAEAELTIDDGGKRKEGIKGERDGGTEGRQHFVALKTTLNASLLWRKGGKEGGRRGSALLTIRLSVEAWWEMEHRKAACRK